MPTSLDRELPDATAKDRGTHLDTNLLVHALLLLFYLLFQFLDGCAIGCGSVCLEDLDVLICEWRNLLLLDLVIREVLLVFLPVLTCCGRLVMLANCEAQTGQIRQSSPW
jgi:hypothetical protein